MTSTSSKEGRFTIAVPTSITTLVISYVGMKATEIKLTDYTYLSFYINGASVDYLLWKMCEPNPCISYQ